MRQVSNNMQTSLAGIANRSRTHPDHRFGNLYGLLNEENVTECFYRLNRAAVSGVDGVDFTSYEAHLAENVGDLVSRLKRNAYHARLVKRVYIPKEPGKKRPLGIPVLEDKALQMCAARILEAIYEPRFRSTSFAYRKGLCAKDAVEGLLVSLRCGRYGTVVDADIDSFFDSIDHERLISMLEKRIADRPFIRLIRKWLKAGILDTDGMVIDPESGTPQGGIISPILANIYLHHVLDAWFENQIEPSQEGKVKYMRYADDTVWCFQYSDEAVRFLEALKERLKLFGLKLSESKTRVVRFSRFGGKRNKRFDFLGFEFFWQSHVCGKPQVGRRTSRKKLRAAEARFSEWIRKHRHMRITKFMGKLKQKLRGYWNYYAINGNSPSVRYFYKTVVKLVYKWLNRRSGRRSYTWEGLNEMLKHFKIPEPKISQIKVNPAYVSF